MGSGRVSKAILVALLLAGVAGGARAQDASRVKQMESELGRLEQVAKVSTATEPTFRACCDGARLAYDLAEPEGDRSGDFAGRGVALADRARKIAPDRAEGHYRYALCLGLYLREHPLSGVSRTKDLVNAGERACQLDGSFDHGGPHRFLAILYSEAPRIVGPGDHDKARDHLAKLLALDPNDEDNKIAAARVYLSLGDDDKARALLQKVQPERGADEASRQSLRTERARLQKKLDD
jgi:hypothetical protein